MTLDVKSSLIGLMLGALVVGLVLLNENRSLTVKYGQLTVLVGALAKAVEAP